MDNVTSLIKRGLILSFSRFSSQAILLLSPLLLVRILNVAEYGSYREFMLYTAILTSVVSFGVPQSLQYFLPKYPLQTKVWVTQTILFTFLLTLVAIFGIWLTRDLINNNTSFDFVATLQLYVFFFVNLNYLESYWLGKKRTDYILYFSTGRLVVRIFVLITAAAMTRNAASVVVALLWFEVARFSVVLFYTISNGLFSDRVTKRSLRAQLSYSVPLGAGSIVVMLNRRIGPLFVSTTIGAEALALYMIGAFAVPIVNTFRGAIGDVIFPEIVEIKTAVPNDALPLWRKATILYCVLMFPVACVFAYYADALVVILFTAEYAGAVPVFMVFAAMLCISCFEFHLPLRAQNANRYFIAGNIIALVCNVALLYLLASRLGLIGPAVAFIGSQVVLAAYLAYTASVVYKVRLSEMLDWRKVALVGIIAIACLPILVIGKVTIDNNFVRLIVGPLVYALAYLFLIRAFRVWDVVILLRRLLQSKPLRYWYAGK